MLQFDSNITLNGEHPVQGSVSIGVDEGQIAIARYEGGQMAGMTGRIEVIIKWQTFGQGTYGITSDKLSIHLGKETQNWTGLHKVLPAWSSDWGWMTNHEFKGEFSVGE